MALWPSIEWGKIYMDLINKSKEYEESSKGWGVDFNGDVFYIVQNVPPVAESAPEEVKKEDKEWVTPDRTLYVFCSLKDGKCLDFRPVKDPSEVKVGFKFTAPYENWKAITKGTLDATRAVLTGKLKLEGDMSKIMRYVKGAGILGKLSIIEGTEYIDEKYK